MAMSSSIREKPLVLRCCFVGPIGLSCFIAFSLESVWINISCPYRHSNRRPLMQIWCQAKLALDGNSRGEGYLVVLKENARADFSLEGTRLRSSLSGI